ncbi:hypothetical protein VKT23_017981 [Stygiomarasmius scandens]|uniref:Glycoside hydrolase family 76 protein n=1 Tax=Marasmiellus scandens TaxID=2682957 RepID=A0ABR1IQQ9_9AGAR
MAEFDIALNQTNYKNQLKDKLLMVGQVQPSSDDDITYGYAAMRAYAAYADKEFLDLAQINWQYGRQYTISDSDVAAGHMASKDFSISVSCNGATMAGGTFWNDHDSPLLNAAGTGSFLILSAALAEATNNHIYLEAAAQSVDFIQNQLYNTQNKSIVEDNISASSKDSCSKSNSLAIPYNVGLTIEGLAIYVSVTQNATKQQLLEEMVSAAIWTDQWQGKEGMIKSGSLEIVRALAMVYNRNLASSDMHKFIKQYLGVQYNAVTELATGNNTNIYGNSWLGPPSSQFNPSSQVAALGALIAAVPLTNDMFSNEPGTSSSVSPIETGVLSSNSKSSKISGKIIGGIVGGISFVLIIGVLLVLLRKKYYQFQSSTPFPLSLKNGNQKQSAGIKRSHAVHTQPSTRQTDEDENLSQALWSSREEVQDPRPQQRHQLSSSPLRSELRALTRSREASLDLPPRNIMNLRNDMTTAELVTILNERLQYGQWREEMPPEYPELARIR